MKLIDKVVELMKELNTTDCTRYIQVGKVLVNEEIILLPNYKIKENDVIRIKESKKWVSRGGEKLEYAIKEFDVDFNEKIVLDIGSSTGGFTDVSLKYGAAKVYALDVGTNQLDYKLRINPKVKSMEKTNIRDIDINTFNEKIDIVVCDVSFISLKKIIDAIEVIKHPQLKLILLLKPQFEAKKYLLEKGGIVSQEHHEEIIYNIKEYLIEKKYTFLDVKESIIKGKKSKNIEYIINLEVNNEAK